MGTHHRRSAASGARHSCWLRKHPRGPNSGEVLYIGLVTVLIIWAACLQAEHWNHRFHELSIMADRSSCRDRRTIVCPHEHVLSVVWICHRAIRSDICTICGAEAVDYIAVQLRTRHVLHRTTTPETRLAEYTISCTDIGG